ncbi:MAG TPA: hypothetical protein VE988_05710, partial [Gemmataceae bacterium]|nr:hypothetical protein [Gemmataceae bacterium]
LLWVLPLLPLVELRPVQRRILFGAVMAVCFLTMRIFPDCFVGEIVRVVGRDGEMAVFEGPTGYGSFLLLTRNAMCAAITAVLAWDLVNNLPQLGTLAADLQPGQWRLAVVAAHRTPHCG